MSARRLMLETLPEIRKEFFMNKEIRICLFAFNVLCIFVIVYVLWPFDKDNSNKFNSCVHSLLE